MNGKKNNIKFGNLELYDQEFESKNVKVRITTYIDEDILLALKKLAKQCGDKYQSLLNSILRSYFETNSKKPAKITEQKIRQIVQEELEKQG